MTRVESGPAKFERYYFLLIALALLGWGGWAVYDGSTGWLAVNRAKARAKLISLVPEERKAEVRSAASFGPRPDEKLFEQVRSANDRSIEAVREKFGAPFYTRSASDGLTDYFVSDYGMVSVPYSSIGLDPRRMTWEAWYKSADEIFEQYYWAAAVGLVALYPLTRFYQAATLRVVLDERTLTYGKLTIGLPEITAVRDYNRKGWVDVYYRAAGAEQKLRLDNQKVAKFRELVELLCKLKGFPNPLAPADDEVDDAPRASS